MSREPDLQQTMACEQTRRDLLLAEAAQLRAEAGRTAPAEINQRLLVLADMCEQMACDNKAAQHLPGLRPG